MEEQWEDHKWIFQPNGMLLDIYVQEVNLAVWMELIDFLNSNYQLQYGFLSENETGDTIDKAYINKVFTDETGELDRKSVAIMLDSVQVNCYFFLQDEIEFDADPKEFKGQEQFKTIIDFMTAISGSLKREVIMTAEGAANYPLITINKENKLLKFTRQSELKQMYDKDFTLFRRIKGFYIYSLMRLLMLLRNSKMKEWLVSYITDLTGATKIHTATKKR